MAEQQKGFGEQLFARLQGKGLSRSQIYKALALQRLNEEVMELGAQGLITEQSLLELSKIGSAARQKQLAEIAVERQLPNNWVKELVRLIRNAEKAASDKEANRYWDFFFEIKDSVEREGPSKELLERVKNFTPDRVAAEAGKGERQVVDYRKFTLESGKGLDVGTSNICSSAMTIDAAQVLFNIQRNAFLDVRSDTFTKKMLMKLGVDHIVQGDKGYVIGDAAFELANIFEKNTRRPMKDGMISPLEPEATLIVSLIISQLLGPPSEPNEICAYSIPADPVDAERNVIYHRGALEQILRKIGYQPRPVLEGHAVVFGELQDERYTGIGISAGAGMFNICIAYRSMPALVFATSRGGDWIDNNVSTALGIPASQVCAVKESGVDLMRPRDRAEEAICIYYRNLIQYTLENIRERFEQSQSMPTFSEPISVVCAGGTSMVKGFIDVFREEFQKVNLPIDVKEVRMARDPLHTVAHGCLNYAREETRAAKNTEPVQTLNIGRSEPSKITKIDTKRFVKPSGSAPAEEKVVMGGKLNVPQQPKTDTSRRPAPEKVVVSTMNIPAPPPPVKPQSEKVVIGGKLNVPAPPQPKPQTEKVVISSAPPSAMPKPAEKPATRVYTQPTPPAPKPAEEKPSSGLGILDEVDDDAKAPPPPPPRTQEPTGRRAVPPPPASTGGSGLGLLDEIPDDDVKAPPPPPKKTDTKKKPPAGNLGILDEIPDDPVTDAPVNEKPAREEGGVEFEEMDSEEPASEEPPQEEERGDLPLIG